MHAQTGLYALCIAMQSAGGGAHSIGEGVWEVHAQHAAGLVAPAARHVAHGVPAAPQDQHGHVELGQELHAVGMALEAQIEAAQTVP